MLALFLFTTMLPELVTVVVLVWTKLALFWTVNVPVLIIAPATVMLWPVLIVNDLDSLTVNVFAENPAVTPDAVVEKFPSIIASIEEVGPLILDQLVPFQTVLFI